MFEFPNIVSTLVQMLNISQKQVTLGFKSLKRSQKCITIVKICKDSSHISSWFPEVFLKGHLNVQESI